MVLSALFPVVKRKPFFPCNQRRSVSPPGYSPIITFKSSIDVAFPKEMREFAPLIPVP